MICLVACMNESLRSFHTKSLLGISVEIELKFVIENTALGRLLFC